MSPQNKQICLQTLLYIVVLGVGVAVGYTNFVQSDLKEEITHNSDDIDLLNEKSTSIQVQLTEIRGDVKLLLERTNP